MRKGGKNHANWERNYVKKTSEILEHKTKERGLQNELKMLKEERTRTDNEMLRSHTVQIKQLEATAGLKNKEQERVLKEQGMRQEKEISQLKDTTRLQHGHGIPLWPIGKERASHPPHPRLNTIAITHVVGDEEVGGATGV